MACWRASLGRVSAGRAGCGVAGEVSFEERQGGELGKGLKGKGEGLGRRAKGRVGRHCSFYLVNLQTVCEKLCDLRALKIALSYAYLHQSR